MTDGSGRLAEEHEMTSSEGASPSATADLRPVRRRARGLPSSSIAMAARCCASAPRHLARASRPRSPAPVRTPSCCSCRVRRWTRPCEQARERALGGELDGVVVGGGDGSVSGAAGMLAGTGVPLGVLPLGTLNHFAKDLGMPADPEAAAAPIARPPRARSTSARSMAGYSSTIRCSGAIPTWSPTASGGARCTGSANGRRCHWRSCACWPASRAGG